MRRVGAAEAGARLLDLLEAWLPSLTGAAPPRARVRAMVAAGAVRVDGVPLRAPGRPLRPGQLVEALLRAPALQPKTVATDRPFTMSDAAVVFRDRWLLAVSKPPGLPTHPTADPRRPSLVSAVESWLKEQGTTCALGVHQRLDRDTSGLVLFTTDPEANPELARTFASGLVVKAYLALTVRPAEELADELTVDAPLAVAPGGRVRVARGGEAALPASTAVVVRERLGRTLLVEARPRTGRKHQVRVHLAHAGLPVLGDRLYGGRAPSVERTMLHAWRLELLHPLSGRRLVLESPLPSDFREALRSAGGRVA
ncbi:MAG TPA: RluA family pseudouridine synthase [Vicinamibacteria bacterium]|nr:RluA family pseudouridine synthase [Vicinamibacteria bacterium]